MKQHHNSRLMMNNKSSKIYVRKKDTHACFGARKIHLAIGKQLIDCISLILIFVDTDNYTNRKKSCEI